jgi:hypothetical protein
MRTDSLSIKKAPVQKYRAFLFIFTIQSRLYDSDADPY